MSGRSYTEAIRLEDQPVANEEFEIVSDTVSSLLSRINNSILQLETSLSKVGNVNYGKSVNLINTLILNFKQLNTTKNELISFDDDLLNHSEIFAKEKLLLEINKSLKAFNKLQTEFTDLEKDVNNSQQQKLDQGDQSLLDLESESTDDQVQLQQQQQQFQIEYDPINAEEMEYQQNLINERNVEIQNISSSILEINEIYQDLSTMIQDQGMTIDSIENNLFSVVNDTRTARNELVKLNNYLKRRNGRCLWLLVILTILLLMIILLIVA